MACHASMADEGFTEVRRGIGMFVRERALTLTGAIEYQALPNRLLDAGEVRPPADVAEVSGLDRDATTAMRCRLLRSGGDPFELARPTTRLGSREAPA
jgi:DNA-binding GntR family transcriptional regulator